MRDKNTFGYGHSEYDELERDEDTYVSDDFDWSEPSGGAVDLFEDDDGPCDDSDAQDGPYCPIDALDALELCGGLAYMIANGEAVSTEEAEDAAGRAVKCFACYEYEQQPWFTEAWPFVKEPDDTRANDKLDELREDAVPDGEREGETTT